MVEQPDGLQHNGMTNLEVAYNFVFTILYRYRVEQPDALQHNGMRNLETECTRGSYEFC